MKTIASFVLGIALLGVSLRTDASPVESVVNSVTVGSFELQVIRQAEPWEGLESFRVKVVTDVGNLNTLTFFEPAVQGEVHQCEYCDNGTPQSTLFLKDIRDGENGNPSWTDGGWTDAHTASDTHILMWNGVNTLLQLGFDRLVEVNDGTNPCGLDTNGGAIKVGLGQMTGGTDHTICLTGSEERLEMDLMQIVIPEDTTVYFNGRVLKVLEDGDVEAAVFENVAVRVPEPSTLLLLVAGVVSLVAVWLQRK